MSKHQTLPKELLSQRALVFKALSNPHRLQIFLEIARCAPGDVHCHTTENEYINCQQQFAEQLKLAPSTISHHFKELRQANLIIMRREGKTILVRINDQAIQEIRDLFDGELG